MTKITSDHNPFAENAHRFRAYTPLYWQLNHTQQRKKTSKKKEKIKEMIQFSLKISIISMNTGIMPGKYVVKVNKARKTS